jgi:hypothetical protein
MRTDDSAISELLYLDSVRVNLGLFQQDSNVIWDLAATCPSWTSDRRPCGGIGDEPPR